MRKKRAGRVANVRNRSRTVAIEVCLSFNFVVIFNFNVFSPSEAQFLSNVPMNRQNSANCSVPLLIIFIVFVRCTLRY